jgi:RHS repeat-associated protein
VWLSAPGVGVLAVVLVALPYTAFATTLSSGPGKYGRHADPFLALIPDHLGTTRAVVNQDGIVIETRDYAPFGESIAHVGPFAVEHRFTGQPQDDQAGGLYHYGARFYNPRWGRFISPDEQVQGFDSQGLNPFAYVLNQPTSGIDPTGEFFDLPVMSIPSSGTMAFGLGAAASAGGSAAGSDLPCGGDACLTRPDYEELGGAEAVLLPGLLVVALPVEISGAAIVGGGLIAGGIAYVIYRMATGDESDDAAVEYTEHAKQRMAERDVSRSGPKIDVALRCS